MVMLDILFQLQPELNFTLQVLHVHHGIRGQEADMDRQLVKQVCEQKQIPFFSEQLNGFDLSSSEEPLRQARYAVFESFLKDIINGKMATAHHLDDRLETFFMRLAKGSGVKGLRSIPVRRGPYIRPLLFLTGDEIQQYAGEHRIAYRTDSTNEDLNKLRNKIRKTLTPVLLDVFGRDFYRGFTKSLHDLEDVCEIYKDVNNKLFSEIVKKSDEALVFNLARYGSLSSTQRRHLLEYCISYFYPLNFGIAETYFKEFDKFTEKAQTGAVFHFEHSVKALKERGSIVFYQAETPLFASLQLSGPNSEAENQFFKITIRQIDRYPAILKNSNANEEIICGERLKFPLLIRGWQAGDYFYPLGLNKKQKLSDFFINQKISLLKKKQVPLIVNKGEIIWVAGYRIDHRYRLREDCRIFFRLTIKFKQYTNKNMEQR